MSMAYQDVVGRLSDLNSALTEKGYLRPNCTMDANLSEVTVWIKTATDGSISGLTKYVESDSFHTAFEAADDIVDDLKPVDVFKKQQAVKQFGRAVDGLRESGIDAAFVDPLSETLQAMTENLLTHEETV